MLLAQLLLLPCVTFGGDNPPTCELASKNIVSRSSSGLAQVSNVGDIQITCRVPARPFPNKPGESRNGLRVATTAYRIAPDGSRKLVPSEVKQFGGGFNPQVEWVDFLASVPLAPEERDAEARKYLAKIEKARPQGRFSEMERQRALKNISDLLYQNRLGHFQLECRIMDGDRVAGVGAIEFQVLFKGHFSDFGFSGKPPQ